MKGQSSIEYLMTYGWMLFAVAIVGSIIYSSVPSSCQSSSQGFRGTSLDIENYAFTGSGDLKFSLKNFEDETITIKKINVSSGSRERSKRYSKSIDYLSSDIVGLKGYSPNGECQSLDVKIIYDRGPLNNQQITGTVRAPVGVMKVPIPDSPIGLNASA
jgi:hypothetical protein